MRSGRLVEMKNLAEAVIMQAVEDLWDKKYRRQGLDFFSGERFRDCADLAGMDTREQLTLLRILRDSFKITPGAAGTYEDFRKAVPHSAASSSG